MKTNVVWILLAIVLVITGREGPAAIGAEKQPGPAVAPAPPRTEAWQDGNQADVGGLHVTFSKPVLVGSCGGYLWFPTVARNSSGDLVAWMTDYADAAQFPPTSKVAWSTDGGLNWSPLQKGLHSGGSLVLPNGDLWLLPYYLRPAGERKMTAPCQICPKGERTLKVVDPGVTVEGWPQPDGSLAPKLGLSGFVFNGQIVSLTDKKYLATLYGFFRDAKRPSLVAAESADGMHWKIRSVIADEKCPLGDFGAGESAIVRLKDGRILCVFRAQFMSCTPYGQCFSSDEGRTWTKPALMPGVFSVMPSLVVRPDGLVALSGGRPGLFLWLNPDGKAEKWHKLDVTANHNAHCPDQTIIPTAGAMDQFKTSSYTEIVPLDDQHLLLIYDRIPVGWRKAASIWVIRVTIGRSGAAEAKRW